mgnify:CR=1 FL=1
MTGNDTEIRIIRLEETVAYQSATIEDLSRQLTEHWKLIERLRHEMRQLTDRFEAIEDQSGAPDPNQRPPHW